MFISCLDFQGASAFLSEVIHCLTCGWVAALGRALIGTGLPLEAEEGLHTLRQEHTFEFCHLPNRPTSICQAFVSKFKWLPGQGLSAAEVLQLLLVFMTFRVQLAHGALSASIEIRCMQLCRFGHHA